MAQYEEITIDQGADVALELFLVNQDGSTKDLTNHSVFAKMKKSYNSDSDYTWDFAANVTVPPNEGRILLGLTNEQTDQMKSGQKRELEHPTLP